jgi:hypothetical protein
MTALRLLRHLSDSPESAWFVLRGGMLTRHLVGPERRATRDLDFLGLFPRDLEETHRRLAAFLPADSVGTLGGEVIWAERAFAGHRFRCESDGEEVQIDFGFGDPLDPPAEWIDYPGAGRVLAARAELLTAWKLDGLFDLGPKRWQAKDLFDLWLLTTCRALDGETLARAIRTAFATHGTPLEAVEGVVYNPDWWRTPTAQRRWAKFRASSPVPVPEDLEAVAAEVGRRLRPALAAARTTGVEGQR